MCDNMVYNERYVTMSNKQFTIELPAYWASALINNDYSGIDDDTLLEVMAWERDNPNACITSCITPPARERDAYSDESYVGRYNGLMCDMLTYKGYYTV